MTTTPLKPPIGYYGSKATVAERIVALFPPHEHYVEPFCGSLSVLLAKHPSKLETVNDLDEELVTFWRMVRDRFEDLELLAAFTPHSRAEHKASYKPSDDELELARRVWVQLTQGRAGTRRGTGWRHYEDPAGTSMPMSAYVEAYRRRLPPASQRLMDASLECLPALDVIAKYGRHEGVLIYADPPYLGSVRARNYRHEMGAESDHRELAAALRACRASVVVSGYHSPLYAELYDGWHRHDIAAVAGNSHAGDRARTEVLWSNRPLGVQPSLFDVQEFEERRYADRQEN